MNINIIAVGKIKEKYFSGALDEYVKRLSRFANVFVTELPDEKIPDGASEKEEDKIRRIEGEKILAKIKPGDYVTAMCIEGKLFSSEEIAQNMEKAMMTHSSLVFVIGGSLGLWDEVKKRADVRMSFGRITLPHQLMRVVLAEQIYRGFKIINRESYHK